MMTTMMMRMKMMMIMMIKMIIMAMMTVNKSRAIERVEKDQVLNISSVWNR